MVLLPKAIKISILIVLFLSIPRLSFASINSWQKGFTLRLNSFHTNADIDAALTDMKNTNIEWLTLSPGWVTDNKYSSNVVMNSRTPTFEQIRYATTKAKSIGMKVMYKPHLDRKDGGWRAFIDPTDKATFFKNYEAMMLQYSDIAAQEGADQICVGAELWKLSTNLKNEVYWEGMIAKIRQRFKGSLCYSANSDSDTYDEGGLPFWDKLDYWGSSMYISVAKTNTPTREGILQEWKWAEDRYYKPMSQKIGLPLLATETGYRSVDGAGISPEKWDSTSSIDLNEQALLYKTFFEFWNNKDYFKGVHFWEFNAGVNAGGPTNNDYTPQGKPAQQVIKTAFASTIPVPTISSTPTPVVSAPIISGNIFINVTAASGLQYKIDNLKTGAAFYIDRNYTVTSYPSFLNNAEFVKTANADKSNASNSFLTFGLTKQVDLYIAYDIRDNTIPNWLTSYTLISEKIITSDITFKLFKKTVSGNQILGGNLASGASGALGNYFVLAVGTSTTPAVTPTPLSSISPSIFVTPTTIPTPHPSVFATPSPAITPTPNVSNFGKISIVEPINGQTISGERKLKFYIENKKPESYKGYFDIVGDGKNVAEMENSDPYKQAKVNYDEFNWSGKGPYTVIFIAKTLSGDLIDTKSVNVYLR